MQGLQQGLQQGTVQGQRLFLESLLKIRFGSLDAELLAIIPPLLKLPLDECSRLSLQLSREELIARFSRTEN
ncbi:MAG TPA: hypothetical protein DCL61_01110 [Cyanobacteria bacterium UBA12227]|nr:hypothetical protein [Cyanobacteria bacterium UBA12227]HAX90229.1 hypothetical protein [Cyanobacteria bacterium UBA11370]HBY79555.1 hypothetical protein [Cyanobacteria bacterium UBA11148]